ncbi:unnamed protein product [Calypogeia fissa]
MSVLGYTDDLPRPCNLAIQTTIASIRAEEIHAAIQTHERASLASVNEEEPGLFLMLLLGIDEWFYIYFLAQKSGVQMALHRLSEYIGILDCMEGDDARDLEQALVLVRAMEVALNKVAADTLIAKNAVPDTAAPDKSPVAETSSENFSIIIDSPLYPSLTFSSLSFAPNLHTESCSSSQTLTPQVAPGTPVTVLSSVDLQTNIQGNPLSDTSWLTDNEATEMNAAMLLVDCTPIVEKSPACEETAVGEPFVPVLPPRHIEWESSKVEGCMWKIKNINNLAPLSLEMWQAWGTVSNEEVLQCRERALKAITLSDKAPVFVSKWPMTVFGAPKYKCKGAAGAKVRGKFDTKNSRLTEHKTKLWNWMRPFFCCSCYYKTSCFGQLVWLDHAVWYMLNHLDDFFTASSHQGRLVMLIKFLSGDARKMVLDHIAFLYIREFMIEAARELVEHPEERFLTQYAAALGIRTIEALMKPGVFSEKRAVDDSADKQKRVNLNNQSGVTPKWKSMYANHTPVPGIGRGRAGRTTYTTPVNGSRDGGGARNRLGHGKALPGAISPIQKRNFNF